MYKSKIYQTEYHSKQNVMPYNFDLELFLHFKCFKINRGLKIIALYF